MEQMTSAILEGLNSEQRQAVSCVDGPVLIVAGAGSGKTRVLTSRIAYILDQGGEPERILALTFTKKAATEMKERIALMVGERKARKLKMGTFHSVFIRFLREYADSLGYPPAFTIYDTGDSTAAVKTCLKELQLDDKIYKPKDVLSRISMAKNNLVTAEAYGRNQTAIQNDAAAKKPKIYEIYRLYAAKCRQAGVMDYDDILLNMNILLKDNPEALEDLSTRFEYIMVDEYQDTNYAQYLILKKLAMKHRNICVVGDDSQSIYAFRGAKIENILNFRKDYPDNRTFRLEQNYRSTRVIVDAANSLIAKNSARIPKNCYSMGDEGEKIRLIQAYSEQEESMLIVSSIIKRMQSDHAQYQDFAILYRTNSQSRALEEALRKRNLPYMIYSGNSFFDRAEVKDMMAYLKLAVNPNDDESFRRIVNRPARGIGDTSLAALIAAAHNNGCSLMKAAFVEDLETYGLKAAAIKKIRSGLYAFFKMDNSIESQAKAANIDELLNSVKSYVEERNNDYFEEMQADGQIGEGVELTDADFPVVTLPEYLENVSLLSAVDVEEDEDSANRIALMTVHSSKGLEFPYVYVAGMEENLFPSGGFMASENDIEEERRLFYVAMTRAEKSVQLSFATTRMRHGKTESNAPSRFIREIDSRYIVNPLPSGKDEDMDNGSTTSFRGRQHDGYPSGSRYGAGQGAISRTRPESRIPGPAQASYVSARQGQTPQQKPGITTFRRPNVAAPVRVPDSEFVPTPILQLRAGQRVEHNRFGYGKILEIIGNSTDLKARIAFDDFGEKILVLKYAKIRVADVAE